MKINNNILKNFNALQDEVMQYYKLEQNMYSAEFHEHGHKYNINVIRITALGNDFDKIGKLNYNDLRLITNFLDEKYPYLVPFYTFTVYFLYPYIDLSLIVNEDIFGEMNKCIENVRKEIIKKNVVDAWNELLAKHKIYNKDYIHNIGQST